MLEYVFQFGIVLVGRAAQSTTLISWFAALVELPPRPFEIEYVTLAVGQLIVRQVHRNSLTRVRTEIEDGGRLWVCERTSASE